MAQPPVCCCWPPLAAGLTGLGRFCLSPPTPSWECRRTIASTSISAKMLSSSPSRSSAPVAAAAPPAPGACARTGAAAAACAANQVAAPTDAFGGLKYLLTLCPVGSSAVRSTTPPADAGAGAGAAAARSGAAGRDDPSAAGTDTPLARKYASASALCLKLLNLAEGKPCVAA